VLWAEALDGTDTAPGDQQSSAVSLVASGGIVPMISDFPFAVALLLILAAFFNYLTNSYVAYSASILAAASCVRSI